jgi:hypothetical protein
VRPDGTHYQVFFDNRWLSVPTEAVSDRTDNPTGNYVTCIQRDHWINGVPDGPRVLCLFKAPGMYPLPKCVGFRPMTKFVFATLALTAIIWGARAVLRQSQPEQLAMEETGGAFPREGVN